MKFNIETLASKYFHKQFSLNFTNVPMLCWKLIVKAVYFCIGTGLWWCYIQICFCLKSHIAWLNVSLYAQIHYHGRLVHLSLHVVRKNKMGTFNYKTRKASHSSCSFCKVLKGKMQPYITTLSNWSHSQYWSTGLMLYIPWANTEFGKTVLRWYCFSAARSIWNHLQPQLRTILTLNETCF